MLTIPYEWQLKINASDIEVKERMADPVDPEILNEMLTKIPDFRRAYEPDGMTVDEFDTYGATVRTLARFRQFLPRAAGCGARIHAAQPGC